MPSQSSRRPDALITVHDLGFSLPDGRPLFHDLTLSFGRERTGLIGRNGIGKSTLAQILAGTIAPTAGTVTRRGVVTVVTQHRELTVGDTVAHALGDGADADAVLHRAALDHLEPTRALATLSGGERTRVLLAAAIQQEPDLLVLDEPTNDLDAASRRVLYSMVNRWGGGMIVISHDRELLGGMDRIVELAERGLTVYGGNYALYEERKAAEDAAARDELAHAASALRRARTVAQETRERQDRRSQRGRKMRANSGMPKILLGMRKENSQKTTARLSRTSERVITQERERVRNAKDRVDVQAQIAVSLPSTKVHARQLMVDATALACTHPDSRDRPLSFPPLSLFGPERVHIAGVNGAGKSTWLKLIMGELTPDRGFVRLGVPHSRVAYLDQHVSASRPDDSVLENFLHAVPLTHSATARSILARYLFRGDAVHARVSSLSGGERLRAALACAVERPEPPQLLVLDEPTNHLDLASLRVVEETLTAYDGALLLVSHDAEFVRRLGMTRTVVLDANLRSP